MADLKTLDRCGSLLEERYGDSGQAAVARLRQWLCGDLPEAYPEIIARLLLHQSPDQLYDAFWQVLPFGTGGRRGRVGYGPNRMNPTTVAMTVRGHCHYLKRTFKDRARLTVVVANDVRVFRDIAGQYRFLGTGHPLLGVSSRTFAQLACQIYAGNGITAYLAQPRSEQAVMATPELSFIINQLGAVGGINLSASHNPPDDNGIKVYDEFGSQPVSPQDQKLVEAMEEATGAQALAFESALAEGLIRDIPEDLHQKYIETYLELYAGIYTPRPEAPIVYTPLCGCGLSTVGEVLHRLGFPFLTPPGQTADGTFAAIPLKAPNPEVAESTGPAKSFAEAQGIGLVLSSDPDADRVGVEARLEDGSWYHFDGHQIAAILCYFLMLDPQGPRRKGLVLETLVTTRLLGKIVQKSPGSLIMDDLLVGFKHMAEVLKRLRAEGRYRHITCSDQQLVLAVEEAHGVIIEPGILDKDATPACLYFAALYQRLLEEGRTLLDYYVAILDEMGGYDTVNRSITMCGAEGLLRKEQLLASLRQSPPEQLAGLEVLRSVDYWDQSRFGEFVSATDRLPRNVLQYFTANFILTVRPSGTEPKLKFYCQLLPPPDRPRARGLELLRAAREQADHISRLIYNQLLARIGLSLQGAGLWLPDLVDLDRKIEFETRTVPLLRDAVVENRFHHLSPLLDWLRQHTASMTPGADPLPALQAPLRYLGRQWQGECPEAHLARDLEKWAGGSGNVI